MTRAYAVHMFVAMSFGAVLMIGCGRLGAPVPPEYVGVGPLLEQERAKKAQRAQAEEKDRTFSAEEVERDATPSVEEVILPPLQPVGTR